MDNQKPPKKTDDHAKQADKLVEKVFDALGGIFGPIQTVRNAKAEATSEKIKAMANIEINELRNRAMNRFVLEEAIKQANIESITQKAVKDLTEDARPDQVENDWIAHFFNKSRLISDDDMQTLWARVLAGQANSPGSYTKRTIDILATMEKSDAILFSKLKSFAFKTSLTSPPVYYVLMYDIDNEIYNKNGMTFVNVSHLESLGLIHFNLTTTYTLRELHQSYLAFLPESTISIDFKNPEHNIFELGNVMLTQAGQQLARICPVEPIDGFSDYLTNRWKSLGYKTTTLEVAPHLKRKNDF